jgi:hypothetical protein
MSEPVEQATDIESLSPVSRAGIMLSQGFANRYTLGFTLAPASRVE